MTQQVKMPEPVAWVRRHPDGALTAEFLEDAVISPVRKESGAWLPMVTTTQAEAYADARAREAQQWISVDDRLPPDDETEVIAVYGGNDTEIVWGSLIHETHADRAYSHWMPLPPPPQHDN